MGIVGYRRLSVAFTVGTLCLLVLLGILWRQHIRQTIEMEATNTMGNIFARSSAQALQSSDPYFAASCLESVILYRTNNYSGYDPLHRIYLRDRSRAVHDILEHLRLISGQDYGDDPQVWIDKFSRGER
jgi:hypothetical protein